MPEKPVIVVQLIHIEGPLKGNIEACTDPIIRIGRHDDCQICFPKDLTLVSRHHAEIVREGNRFKLVDHSTNGTFVNGKAARDTVLKEGDVLMIGDGGPKVSFLTEIKTSDTQTPVAVSSFPEKVAPVSLPSSPRQSLLPQESVKQPPPANSEPPRGPDPAEVQVQAPIVIQFGPTIQSFNTLPLVIGKKDDCNFILNHADIIDRHIQIFFHENNYWVKDLTGQGLITINDTPVGAKAPLNPGSQLSLGPRGPTFQFLSGGRLVEVADQPAEAVSQKAPNSPETPWQSTPKRQRRGKGRWILFIGLVAILIAVIVLLFFYPGIMDGAVKGGLREWWYRLVEAIRRLFG